jgi:hypothetical protein
MLMEILRNPRLPLAAVFLGAAALFSQAASAQVALRESAIETMTDAVVLPSSNAGSVTFNDCEAPCVFRSVQLNEQSTYFIGPAQVTLKQFSDYVLREPAQFLMVFHEPDQPIVTRLMVFGQFQP